jgi:hypothetical protein
VVVAYELAGASEKFDEFDDKAPLLLALRWGFAFGAMADWFAPLIGEAAFDLAWALAAAAAALWDFFRCAAGLDKWLRPVGLPRRTEHFWKCRFRISLLEKVSLQSTHI